jgi:hypothetical protein
MKAGSNLSDLATSAISGETRPDLAILICVI